MKKIKKTKNQTPIKVYNKIISSNPSYLPEVEEFVLDIAEEYNLGDLKINNLAISVAEAASNCIIHGNKMDDSKKVTIKLEVYEDKIVISFKDEGEGFDPAAVPDPTAPENILKDSGRGLHIMRTFLDDLQYNFSNGGTEVILTIKR